MCEPVMDSPDFVDPYIDPETGVLRNLVGATTTAALRAAEADLVLARAVQLSEDPVGPSTDLAGLLHIHRVLFQDVYDWAGQLRTVDVRKDVPGALPFTPVALIPRAAQSCFTELHEQHLLAGLLRHEFIRALAHHYEQINYVHPFREGNGRVQRIFWNWIAGGAGWILDWRSVDGIENDEACRAASDAGDIRPLEVMFEKVVSALPGPPRTVAQHGEIDWMSPDNRS